MDWPRSTLSPLGITVGPCAWDLEALLSHPEFVREHPSILMVDPHEPEQRLAQAAPLLADLPDLPVALGMTEPTFARRFPAMIAQRLAILGRERVDAAILWVEQVEDLKAGRLLDVLRQRQEAGDLGAVGLGHADARAAEWLALNAGARLLVTDYSLANQSARYRALPAAHEHGLACVTTTQPPGRDALRFALAERERALPTLVAPPPDGLDPMSSDEVEQAWQAYQKQQSEPDPLPRGLPPGAD